MRQMPKTFPKAAVLLSLLMLAAPVSAETTGLQATGPKMITAGGGGKTPASCLSVLPQNAQASYCGLSIEGAGTKSSAKHLKVAPHQPEFAVGDEFPVYKYNMLIDPPRYGLPPVKGNWRYYRAGAETYRVDARNYRVIEVVDTKGHALLR